MIEERRCGVFFFRLFNDQLKKSTYSAKSAQSAYFLKLTIINSIFNNNHNNSLFFGFGFALNKFIWFVWVGEGVRGVSTGAELNLAVWSF